MIIETIIEPLNMMFADGFKIILIDESGVSEKHFMKFEDGIKNVFKWNVLSPFLAKLKIIGSDYHVSDPQRRWENEVMIISYLRRRLLEGEYPLYVPKLTINYVKSIDNSKLQRFLNRWRDYRYTILEFVEGPTLREILLKPEHYNLNRELKILGECIGIMHSLGVCQFDRRTSNDIKIAKGFSCIDYSLAKKFDRWDSSYYRGVAFDIDNEKLWLPEELFNTFKDSHDQYLSTVKDFDMEKYKKALSVSNRLSKLSMIMKPLLFQVDGLSFKRAK